MKEFCPSPQQQAVFDSVINKRSKIVEAVAGSGKTTTLLHLLKHLGGRTVSFAAYNKKIADEIKERMGQMGVGPNVRAGTFHSFGYNAWMRTCPSKPRLEEKKLYLLCDEMNIPKMFHKFCNDTVSLAKQSAIGVSCPFDDRNLWNYLIDHHELEESLTTDDLNPVEVDDLLEEAVEWSIKLVRRSVETNQQVIDFDDMIYAPLIHDVRMFQNDVVLIDEAQDTNSSRRALAKKMLKPGGMLIAVGDRHQAIYGFTGADHNALDIIADEFNCEHLPLTVTYRCPQLVVAHAQQWVSHIQAHPEAPMGEVRYITDMEFRKLDQDQIGLGSAILCRNTKPLIELAFSLIRRSIPAHVEGRDIGRNLLTLVNKWKVDQLHTLRQRLEQYLEREEERFLAKGQEQKAANLRDRVETLFIIMEAMDEALGVNGLRNKINELFQDTTDGSRRITLSTIHKAKGREWDRVWWYGRNKLQPSPYARQDWQYGQEINLMYVATTRAKCELIEVTIV